MTLRPILHAVVPMLALALMPLPASAATVRIYVTNSAGDTIDVIDPVSNKVVQEIKDVVGATASRSRPMRRGSMSATRRPRRSTSTTARPAS